MPVDLRPRSSVLITTEEILTPALKPGVYGVFYRPEGISTELLGALKQGHRVLVAAAKAKVRAEAAAKRSKGKKPAKKKPVDKKPKKPAKKSQDKWKAIVRKFGYSMKEIEDKDVSELKKYVYVTHTGLGDEVKDADKLFKVSTEKPQILFRTKTGKWVAAVETDLKLSRPAAKPNQSGVVVTDGKDVEFKFGVMQDQKQFDRTASPGREFPLRFKLQLKEAWKN